MDRARVSSQQSQNSGQLYPPNSISQMRKGPHKPVYVPLPHLSHSPNQRLCLDMLALLQKDVYNHEFKLESQSIVKSTCDGKSGNH